MKSLNLGSDDPGSFSLAADARCGPTDYANDHIWEFSLEGGDPPALSVHTTYGLRARSLRVFPRFGEGDTFISNPSSFVEPPRIHRFYPNYLDLVCTPFTGIDVRMAYWVPDSHTITGRIHIKNSRLSSRDIRLECAALLSTPEKGLHIAPHQMEGATALCGQTEDLAVLLFMTGGAQFSSGPHPALAIDLNLPAGGERQFTWVLTAKLTHEEAFTAARSAAARHWDKEIAHLDVLNAGLIEIESGNPDWDTAFTLAQNTAYSLLIGPTEQLPHTSFALTRQPDQGYSRNTDGSSHAHLWNGQPALEADFINGLLLPAAPHLAQGILENFLASQLPDGFIDWKPGLGGQRSGIMATPVLAQMAWKIYQVIEDMHFLEDVYPKLLKNVLAWFTPQQDRDGDGIPEWTHLVQAGLEEHPTFSQDTTWAQGADISFSESPALCALLYNEIQTLIKMAAALERSEPLPSLLSLADNLKSAIDASWDEAAAMYRIWDRETHLSPSGEIIAEQHGPGEIFIHKTFEQPARLVIHIEGAHQTPRQADLYLHGTSPAGKQRVERIAEDQFQWLLKKSATTSQRVYAVLESVDVRGIMPEDHIRIEVVNLAALDFSLFLPLLAKIPDPARAEKIIRQSLLNPERFWRPHGISHCASPSQDEKHPCDHTSVLWSSLIGQCLLSYGYRQEAAELVKRLMDAITQNLKTHKAFAHNYHVITGRGVGERNALQGLAPLRLFLDTIGVRLISPTKVAIEGQNPFPHPVTIAFRGLSITREAKKTRITFPGGQTAVVRSPEPHIVTIENQT